MEAHISLCCNNLLGEEDPEEEGFKPGLEWGFEEKALYTPEIAGKQAQRSP